MERERLLNGDEDDDSRTSREGGSAPTIAQSKKEAQVNLEGGDWLLTTLVITLDAILLSLYQADEIKWGTFLTWIVEHKCESGWSCELSNTLFIVAVAIVNVCVVIPIINVNVRTPAKLYWRFWVIIAWLALALLNTMTLRQLIDSIRMCYNGEGDIESWTAHFWLVSSAFITVILVNIRCIYLYGLFSCLTCSEDETLRTTPGLMQIYNREYGIQDTVQAERFKFREDARSQLNVFKPPKLIRFDTGKFLEEAASGFHHFLRRKTQYGARQGALRFRQDTYLVSDRSFLGRLKRNSVSGKIIHAKGYLSSKIKEAYQHVAEVDNVFEYSSWMKSAAVFAILMLIYNCIKTTEIFFDLASSWDYYHKLAHQFQDELYYVQESLGHLQQNLTDISHGTQEMQQNVTSLANETLPAALEDIEAVQTTLDVFEKTSGKAYDVAGAVLDVALLTTTRLVNITDLKGNTIVGAFYYIDSIIPILKYTCMVGYPIGTFIGLNSLYQVLVQHKRMSLGLEQALTARAPSLFGKELDEEDARLTLLGIEKKYQIGGAVYFYGILMSTAVVQQHIFGFLVTMILAIIVDIKNFDVLLNIGGYLLFVYLAVLLTNLFVTHVIGDRVLTKEGFQIRHPWGFFLYLFTFSMVHAVLGFLYALWRALLLLVTTFWVLNRLDVSLFLAGKQLDNGHYSFMSMLLLTRVIRLTNISQGYTPTPRNIDEEEKTTSSMSIPQNRAVASGKPQTKRAVAFNLPDEESSDEEMKGEGKEVSKSNAEIQEEPMTSTSDPAPSRTEIAYETELQTEDE